MRFDVWILEGHVRVIVLDMVCVLQQKNEHESDFQTLYGILLARMKKIKIQDPESPDRQIKLNEKWVLDHEVGRVCMLFRL